MPKRNIVEINEIKKVKIIFNVREHVGNYYYIIALWYYCPETRSIYKRLAKANKL